MPCVQTQTQEGRLRQSIRHNGASRKLSDGEQISTAEVVQSESNKQQQRQPYEGQCRWAACNHQLESRSVSRGPNRTGTYPFPDLS